MTDPTKRFTDWSEDTIEIIPPATGLPPQERWMFSKSGNRKGRRTRAGSPPPRPELSRHGLAIVRTYSRTACSTGPYDPGPAYRPSAPNK
jgi:hypothetical protein